MLQGFCVAAVAVAVAIAVAVVAVVVTVIVAVHNCSYYCYQLLLLLV